MTGIHVYKHVASYNCVIYRFYNRWKQQGWITEVESCTCDMLTVDERDFQGFWGPSAIKPLNFNYEFQPTFVGQNIWNLTDDLFVSGHKRAQDDSENRNDFMKVIYSKLGKRDAQKKSSRYKQFPSVDHDIRQKSSSAQGSFVSRGLNIVGSPLSERSQQLTRTPPKLQVANTKTRVPKPEANPSSTSKTPQVHSSPIKIVGKKQSATLPKTTLKKRSQQSGLTLKLSQQETEKLLKTLDFKVQTARKPKPRDRSRSEAFGRAKGQIISVAAKSASKVELRKPRTNKNPKKTNLGSQGLLRSTQMSSSSEKNSRSSGLNELVGPLPRVNWTPTRESIQQEKSSSASLKKNCSQKSGASISKRSKTSSTSKKLGKNTSGSQDISREPSSEENTTAQQKIKTTKVKIIPKLTLNNQLLKSTTPKTESRPTVKKITPNAPLKKKTVKANTDSILWTPEKIALLDQITNDRQLKAVLMSAGDTYIKTRKYFAVNSKLKSKPSVKQASSLVKKEPNDSKRVKTAVPGNTAAVLANKTSKQGNLDAKSKGETSMANGAVDGSLGMASKPEPSQSSGPEGNVQFTKKRDQNQVTNSQLLKTDGFPKTAQHPKSSSRKMTHSPLKDKKLTNAVGVQKKRPKYTINSKQVRKVEER